MSWLGDLYKTYENNLDEVGKNTRSIWGKEVMLLPISHAYQNAQLEVTLTTKGEFYSGKVVPKEAAQTMVPVTIASSGRSGSTAAPHGLHDGLVYVAGDLLEYGGTYKKNKEKKTSYEIYIENLKKWCESEFSNPRVQSILAYVEKGTLITDLIGANVLIEKDGQLLPKWKAEYGDKPEIFSVLAGDQFASFVRFNVHNPGESEPKVWEDSSVSQSFVQYYATQLPAVGLDYVTGEYLPVTEMHPSKIRYGGDMAKIISGNDDQNFTYRGRFSDKNQVATIGYEVSQKGHNALKLLISKQGYTLDGRVFLTWGDTFLEVPTPEASTVSLMDSFFGEDEESDSLETIDKTAKNFSENFVKGIQGYGKNLKHFDPIHVMILDSATPGRMGILYYRSLEQHLYLARLENWHKSTSWYHSIGWKKAFYGAPSLKEIAEASYGSKGNEKLIKNTITQLVACVVENQSIPFNVTQGLLKRASNPLTMEKWEWEKTLGIACGIMKNYFGYSKEEQLMALDTAEKDRNYLFGRMLAVADKVENVALYNAGMSRTTNAVRYMNAFSNHPVTTWKIIQANLTPYYSRLKNNGLYYQQLLSEIGESFDMEDFTDASLNGKYLLGYYSQRYELNKKNEKNTEE